MSRAYRVARWSCAAAVAGLGLLPLGTSAVRAAVGAPVARVILAQDAGGGDETEVAPAEVDKYVAVYRAMHRDHALTVEQAAAQQGMSVAAFRALENRIERDGAAMERARDELQNSAVHASPAASATH